MSIEKTVLAFKEHLSSLLEQPVLIGWPASDEKGVHLYLYSVSESELSSHQAIPNEQYISDRGLFCVKHDLHLLVIINPEGDVNLFDKVIMILQQHPKIDDGRDTCLIFPTRIEIETLLQIFSAKNQPYQLTLPYTLKDTLLNTPLEEPLSSIPIVSS